MKGLLVCQYFPRRIIATMQAGSNLKELCWIPCTFKNSKVKLNQNYFSISRVYALWAYVAVIVFRPWPTVSRLTWWERRWYFSQFFPWNYKHLSALLWYLRVTDAERSNGTKPNQTKPRTEKTDMTESSDWIGLIWTVLVCLHSTQQVYRHRELTLVCVLFNLIFRPRFCLW